jgi:hypothetical protein
VLLGWAGWCWPGGGGGQDSAGPRSAGHSPNRSLRAVVGGGLACGGVDTVWCGGPSGPVRAWRRRLADELQQTGEWLGASASGRRPVLGVDDAQWLDHGSATIIHYLTMTGVVSVVATVPSGEPAPGSGEALWKDGLTERVEVQALNRAETTELVEIGLGGPVDRLTAERLWQLSRAGWWYEYMGLLRVQVVSHGA